jgi:hypothetical protein
MTLSEGIQEIVKQLPKLQPLKLLEKTVWPAVVIVSVLLMHRPLINILSRAQSISITIRGVGARTEIKLPVSAAEETLESMYREMRILVDQVPVEQRRLIIEALQSGAEGTVKVSDIYPGFCRESDEHKHLRGLRNAQLIRPVRHGQFWPNSTLEIKPFGKLMLKYQGEYIFYGKTRFLGW